MMCFHIVDDAGMGRANSALRGKRDAASMEIAQGMLTAEDSRAAIAQAGLLTVIQIRRRRCRLSEMRLQPHLQRRATRAINGLVIVCGLYFWWSCLPPPPDPWILNLTNNPDKF